MVANSYAHELQGQHKQRVNKAKYEKSQEKVYAQLAIAQQDKEAASRQIFFDKLNGFQLATDKKAAQFSDFMKGRDWATLSRLDEERMLREQQVKDAKANKVDEQKDMRFSQLKADNISALKRQMAEKEQVKRLKKLEDDSYA